VAIVNLEDGNLHSTLSKPGVVVVECWARWCGGCAAFEPAFDAVSRRHEEVTFAKLDTGTHPGLSDAVGASQVPTLLIYRDGLLLLRQPGGVDESTLEDMVSQSLDLDMNAVRAEAEREAREAVQAVTQ
jgi:thioredoxin 1